MPDLLCDVQGSGAADPAAAAGAMKIGELPPFVLHRLDTPVVCGLNGPAAGYGMDLALGCDFVIASDQAMLVPPMKRGVVRLSRDGRAAAAVRKRRLPRRRRILPGEARAALQGAVAQGGRRPARSEPQPSAVP